MSNFHKYRVYAFCAAIFLVTFIGFLLCSLSSSNPPALSHDSGFYESEFQLTLSAPRNSEIYYTLDGSIPTKDSIHYDGPITISNKTGNPNVYSARTDVAAYFRTDLLEKYEATDRTYHPYVVPDYLVDKCTVLRAVSINSIGIASEVTSASFFVELSPEDYPNCNIISLVTDPANLFDPEIGIYVTGKVFEEYMQTGPTRPVWRLWEANYRQRGSDWERSAVFHMFNSDGQLFLEKNGAIRIHGGLSRSMLPRSLNLYANYPSNNIDTFGYNLFGNDYDPGTVTLSSGGNQLITQFNDYMMTQRVRDLNIATMLFEPYVLFIDGEYWGFYWMTEKIDETYLAHYYNVNPDNCIIIKDHTLEAGRSSDMDLYNSMVEYITSNDMSIPENYAKACTLIDIDSCLDYFCTMTYIARHADWPGQNWAMWRTRQPEGSSYGDTKWRWILYDCNSDSMSVNVDNINHDTLSLLISEYPLFASLWENVSFREAFRDRILEIADTNFNAHEMDQFIQEYNKKMEPVLAQSWKRFYGSENHQDASYDKKMERIRQFFLNRKTAVEGWFADSVE